MIRIARIDEIRQEDILNRKIRNYPEQENAVRRILEDVRREGDEAVRRYTLQFDGVCPQDFRVSQESIDQGVQQTDPAFLQILERAKRNIVAFHEKQVRSGFEIREQGKVLGQRITPIESVGVYVPGGTASYPSTVLMNVIPAKIAGVKRVVMVTPPDKKTGKIRPELLAAAQCAGVDEIYACGGAQAIGALAYGTQSIAPVNKIVGPGNIFVALAKRQVYGTVGIDMIAGPSEILVIADKSANADFLAADLLSQAEHDALASAVLVTDDEALARQVKERLTVRLAQLPRAEIATAAIVNNSRILLVKDMDEAAQVSDAIAPEHLELAVADPFAMLKKVRNAGSIFLGQYAPEPLGDYLAGPNHTLPTSGNAKFSSPLSVDDFIKKSSYLYYDKTSLQAVCDDVVTFAEKEGLSAHARAIQARFLQDQ